MPPVKLTWYDGGLMPPDPEELENETLDPNGGVLYVGKKAKLLHYSDVRTAAADVEAQLLRRAQGTPRTRAARRSRDELGPRDQGHRSDFGAVRLRREADRDHAARHRLAAREHRSCTTTPRPCASRITSRQIDFLTREYRAGYSL